MATAYGTQPVQNYLVPATGTTHAWRFAKNFLAGEFEVIEFRNIALNGRPFAPSGVLIDNTNGTADCVVTILEYTYNIVCKKGQTLNLPYPAPLEQSVSVTGEGPVTVIFVDYPVLPYSSAAGGGGGGGGGGGRTSMFHGFQGLMAKGSPTVGSDNTLTAFSDVVDPDGWKVGTNIVVPAGVEKIRVGLNTLAQGSDETRPRTSWEVVGAPTIPFGASAGSTDNAYADFGILDVTEGQIIEFRCNPQAACGIVGGMAVIEVLQGAILLT